MTSHYMRCNVKASLDRVFEVLSGGFGNVYSKKLSKDKDSSSAMVLGEQYFFRVNSDVAVLMILEERSSTDTQVEIISCAGGAGVLEISYSAHAAYVHDVKNLLSRSGFEVEVGEEISYFGRSSG